VSPKKCSTEEVIEPNQPGNIVLVVKVRKQSRDDFIVKDGSDEHTMCR
jgi:hypothetical protein